MQCYHVAVFMYSPKDFSGYQHCLGEGEGVGLPNIRNGSTTKLIATAYRYPEVQHKCKLQMLFLCMSQKILIVAPKIPVYLL